ncbi:MAG: hypothetical protein IPG80_00315 [Anaerolineales bacterium]|uniref:FliH/SctL family protein n=1 Tax=Candidatus Villigracilis vicinus TaxID=3140679 RepID=UPI003135589D|nr:hypothetical protein [Anaerolineales bacterium]
MKSLYKANQNETPAAWNPPEFDEDATVNEQKINKEDILSIFQNLDVNELKTKAAATGKAVKSKNIKFASWKPGQLGQAQAKVSPAEWNFIEVTDTPFDRTWKVQSPAPVSNQPSSQQLEEDETALLIERARHQAEEIILAAQAEADDILLQAEAEIQEQKQAGFQQGQREARTEIEDALKAVHSTVEEIENWKQEFFAQGEQVLIDMLKDISNKMFGEGAKLNAQALHANLSRVMENAHGLGALKVFLNPNDARLLDSYWSEQQMLIHGEPVKVIASNSITPGGCLIKGNIGTVDGRVETQLNAILKSLDETDTPEE